MDDNNIMSILVILSGNIDPQIHNHSAYHRYVSGKSGLSMNCSANSGRTDSSTYEIDRENSMVFCQYDCDSKTIEAPLLMAFSRELIF